MRGSHVGTYLPSSGIWHHTQRFLKKGVSNSSTVHHLDFDASTREHATLLPDDKVLLYMTEIFLLSLFGFYTFNSFCNAAVIGPC